MDSTISTVNNVALGMYSSNRPKMLQLRHRGDSRPRPHRATMLSLPEFRHSQFPIEPPRSPTSSSVIPASLRSLLRSKLRLNVYDKTTNRLLHLVDSVDAFITFNLTRFGTHVIAAAPQNAASRLATLSCLGETPVRVAKNAQLNAGVGTILLLPQVTDVIELCYCLFQVFVGDSYQQLGSSGGTVSALDKVTHTHKFFLHQSFRFGPEVSYVAQCTLEALHGVPHRTVVGAKIKDSFVHAPNPRLFDPSSKLKRAYIAKSNVELYKIATEMCEDTRYLAASMTFAGGLSKYGYDDVMDIFNLYQIQEGLATRESANIQNPLVAKFETVAELKEYAESNDDDELFSKIEMFNYSGSSTPYHVTLLTQRCSNTEASVADITFSTVHMAKGLEWDWVILTGDFIDNNIILITNIDEELRLAYVSVTRARKFFTINKAVLYALLFAHDELDVLVARKSVEESVVCLWCRTLVTPASSPLIIKALSYYICHSGNRFPGGYMCNGCATNEIFEAAIRTHRSIDCEMEVFARASRLRLITGKQHESARYNYNATNRECLKRGSRQFEVTANLMILRRHTSLVSNNGHLPVVEVHDNYQD
ncbi:F-box DNA helicase 1-like [Procambarus clarkii]|uniref:F-box DNA helicase 1-like n=1 Tax=Procambarus clarkii TaxID=6728 RepID=UPI003744905E